VCTGQLAVLIFSAPVMFTGLVNNRLLPPLTCGLAKLYNPARFADYCRWVAYLFRPLRE
jgi:hypothetical protein